MHALAPKGSEQKRKACINFTRMDLFSKTGIVMEIHLPHNWNLWTSYVIIILVQCNLLTIFQSIVIPVRYHNKFPKFVCNVIDLCTHLMSNYKNRLEFPFKLPHFFSRPPTMLCTVYMVIFASQFSRKFQLQIHGYFL